ncbi:MAG: PAS domain S-box protein [Elusimicrobiota bacterium]
MDHPGIGAVSTPKTGWGSLAAGICAATALACGGLFLQETRSAKGARFNDLAAIGKLKAETLVQWRSERLTDARLNASGLVRHHAIAWLRSGRPSDNAPLLARMRLFQEQEGYQNMVLAAPDGRVLLSLDHRMASLEPASRTLVSAVVLARSASLGDLFACSACRSAHMDAAAPVLDDSGRPVAVLLLRSDPAKVLFPLIGSWPLPSRTGEVVLVRREGGDAVFLNPLRRLSDAPLTTRIPLSETSVPAVQAVLGRTARFEGSDYRGEPVMADLQPVPGSPWFLVTKQDQAELLAEARRRGAAIAGGGLLFLLFSGALLATFYYRREQQLHEALWRSDRARRSAEEVRRATFYGIGDGVISCDKDGLVNLMNPVAEALTGWKEADASGKPLQQVFRIVNEFTRAVIDNPVQVVLRKGTVVGLANHTMLIAKDGTERPIADSGAPIYDRSGTVIGVVLVFRDQSDERAAQNKLAESETRYRTLFSCAKDGIALADAETGVLVDCNEALASLVRRGRDDLIGKPHSTLHPAANVRNGVSGTFRAHRAEGAVATSEDVLLASDGTLVPVEIAASHVRLNGRDHLLGVFRDLSGRKKAEEENRRLSLALSQSPTPIILTDARGDIEYVNLKFTEVTGYASAEILGKNPRFLKSGETPPEEYRLLWEAITSGREWRGVFRNKRKDGSLYWEKTAIAPVHDASGAISHFMAFKEDITAQRALEEQLRQSQKMESIGRLAGGVAHDFNNLLTAIIGYGRFVLDALGQDDPKADDVREVLSAAERAAALTRHLLAFSRRQVLCPVVMDINGAVGRSAKMLRRIIGENIRIETRLGAAPCLVKVDAVQMDQVLMNLAVNARDAMPGGGTLTIATEVVRPPEDFFTDKADLEAGPLVHLSVSDTGTGMDASALAHLFEPFFTTKERGKGTGLGLATVHGIVKQSGGEIAVESSPGKGTAFSLYFPLVPEHEAARTEDLSPVPAQGRETILLVEDEASVMRLGTKILAGLGYAVLSAADGPSALAVMRERGADIALLVTDVVMPGLNGRDLARQAANLRPGLKVLYMSGHPDDAIVEHGVLEPGLAFLYKPFTGHGLALKVRTVLDGPPDAARA